MMVATQNNTAAVSDMVLRQESDLYMRLARTRPSLSHPESTRDRRRQREVSESVRQHYFQVNHRHISVSV